MTGTTGTPMPGPENNKRREVLKQHYSTSNSEFESNKGLADQTIAVVPVPVPPSVELSLLLAKYTPIAFLEQVGQDVAMVITRMALAALAARLMPREGMQ